MHQFKVGDKILCDPFALNDQGYLTTATVTSFVSLSLPPTEGVCLTLTDGHNVTREISKCVALPLNVTRDQIETLCRMLGKKLV